MLWERRTVEDQRREFAQAALECSNFSALCREYGITRRTGMKWNARYEAQEPLSDRSRRPNTSAHPDSGSGRAPDSGAQDRESWVGRKDAPQSAGKPGRAESTLRKDRKQYSAPPWLHQSGGVPEAAAIHSLRERKVQHDVANGL